MFHDYMESDRSDRHIFDSSKNKKEVCSGFMDVPQSDNTGKIIKVPPKRWSGCSVHDFRKAFRDDGWERIFKDEGSDCFANISTSRMSIKLI